jgi:hypothetical protein
MVFHEAATGVAPEAFAPTVVSPTVVLPERTTERGELQPHRKTQQINIVESRRIGGILSGMSPLSATIEYSMRHLVSLAALLRLHYSLSYVDAAARETSLAFALGFVVAVLRGFARLAAQRQSRRAGKRDSPSCVRDLPVR